MAAARVFKVEFRSTGVSWTGNPKPNFGGKITVNNWGFLEDLWSDGSGT